MHCNSTCMSLMKCIGLYVSYLILSAFLDTDTEKFKNNSFFSCVDGTMMSCSRIVRKARMTRRRVRLLTTPWGPNSTKSSWKSTSNNTHSLYCRFWLALWKMRWNLIGLLSDPVWLVLVCRITGCQNGKNDFSNKISYLLNTIQP